MAENDKERKGAGVPPWMSGSAKVGGPQLARGVSAVGARGGMAKFAAMLTSKAAISGTLVLGLAVGGGLGLFEMNRASKRQQELEARKFHSAMVRSEDSGSGPVMGRSAAGPSALTLASQANKGVYGSADAPKPAAAEEGAEGEEEYSDAVEEAEGDAIGGTDPQAMAAEMAEGMMKDEGSKAKGGLDKRFGQMSSNLGGGNQTLAGGAGLSGGIGGNFAKPKLSNSQLRQAQALSRGRRAAMTRTKQAARNRGSSLSGATAKRLDNMNRAMSGSRKQSAAEQADVHSQQWDSAQPGGQAIQGAGASGVSDGGFSTDEGGGTGEPVGTEGSAGSGSGTGDAYDVPDTGGGENVTPYQGLVTMASVLSLMGWILCIIVGALADTQFMKTYASAIMALVLVIGAIVTMLGAMIMAQYGQNAQGGILTFSGVCLCAAAIYALVEGTAGATFQKVLWIGGIVGMAASIGAMLA